MSQKLTGRRALVTGASRRQGIGFATARRLLGEGANVCIHHYRPHDDDQPWGGDDLAEVLAELRAVSGGGEVVEVEGDLGVTETAERVVGRAVEQLGGLDILVCNQARSGGDGPLLSVSPDQIDGHFDVNTRATLLLTQAFARHRQSISTEDGEPQPRVIWLTSGQQLGPMAGEVAYVTSKAALAGATATVADELIELGIGLNTVNPGPVNTGYLDVETTDRDPNILSDVLKAFPAGRFGEPDDPARLISWLVSDDARWVVGQIISTEGGFRRWN